MGIKCWLGFHRGANPYFVLRNGPMMLGECPRCFTEIFKTQGDRWRPVPARYRTIWQSRSEILGRLGGPTDRTIPPLT